MSTLQSPSFSKYRPIGINLHQSNRTSINQSPGFKSILHTINQDDYQTEMLENADNDEANPEMEALFSSYDSTFEQIQAKLETLRVINNNVEHIVSTLEQEIKSNANHNHRHHEDVDDGRSQDFKPRFNPLPTPNDEDDEFDDDEYEKDDNEDDIYDNLPSSPESFGSNTSQLEIELNNKITKLSHLQSNNPNIIKLKNIVNHSLDIMNFETNDQKMVNQNQELYQRSQILKEKLGKLVDSFT